jgi:hypothetical protein
MAKLTLQQYQQQFNKAMYQGDQSLLSPSLIEAITPGGLLSPRASLRVYSHGHFVRLTEALGETYEAVWWVSGDEDFFALVKKFILSHPSQFYNLSAYGQEFPIFLEQECPFPDLAFLPDLARFEWLFKQIFHAPQHEPASAKSIQAIGQNGHVRLDFGESVSLFSSAWAIYDIWKLRGTSHEGQPDVAWDREQRVLLYKKDSQIFVNELTAVEFQLCTDLLSGATVEDTMSRAAETIPDLTSEQVSRFFQMLFHTGSLQRIES